MFLNENNSEDEASVTFCFKCSKRVMQGEPYCAEHEEFYMKNMNEIERGLDVCHTS